MRVSYILERLLRRQEAILALAILVLGAAITAVNPAFLTLENLLDLARNSAFTGVLAVGVLFVLVSGGMDVSFTAVATVGEYAMAVVMVRHGGNVLTCFLVATAVGTTLGLVNAVLVDRLEIPPIIATIATLNVYYGLLTVVTGGRWIYALPPWFQEFANLRIFTLRTASGAPYGLSIITALWLGIMVAAWVVLRHTTLGRAVHAMGGNLAAARRAGLDVFRLRLVVYALMGALAGAAGVLQALIVQTVAPNAIVGKELGVIAAVVLGGASLSGGTGTVLGTLLGLSLLAVLGNGLTLMRVPSYWYDVFIGVVLLVSVGTAAWRRRARAIVRLVSPVREVTPARADLGGAP